MARMQAAGVDLVGKKKHLFVFANLFSKIKINFSPRYGHTGWTCFRLPPQTPGQATTT
jgi:hypothetical protein